MNKPEVALSLATAALFMCALSALRRVIDVRELLPSAIIVALLAGSLPAAQAQQPPDTAVATVGRSIQEVIDEYRQLGFPFAYSTALLPKTLIVKVLPTSSEPRDIVSEILAPYELTITPIDDLLVVSRVVVTTESGNDEVYELTEFPEPPIPELSVSASRYEILRELLDSPSFISQRTIQQLPILGEDPLRAVQRLPGAAASGVSAQTYLRGGERDDTGMILNGQRLLDPFHIREYHNLFSAIDSRAVNGIEVFTGGFPAQYGDQMGGLVLIDTVTPDKDRHTELGLSVYNTSLLSAGTVADGDVEWLVSARRGNLDLVLNPDLGEPKYNDVFAEISVNFSDRSKVSVNGLVARDNILLITESEPEELEQSESDSRNAQFWINWRQDWTDKFSSYTTVSISELDSERTGSNADEEEIVGFVDDKRNIEIYGIQLNMTYQPNDEHLLKFGGEFRHVKGDFDYYGEAEYFGDFARFPSVTNPVQRSVVTDVEGDAMALFIADRWQVGHRTATEIGVRWDKQTYTDTIDENQISPRISFVHAAGQNTDLRLTWGRYYQSQGINQLQVEDGISTYFPAQRADQTIFGITHRFGSDYSIRAEVYSKTMDRIRPRFENMLDPLTVMPELKPDRVMVDPSSAQAHGFEISLARNPSEKFSWWTSYVWAEVRDTIDGAHVPRSWDQQHAIQGGMLWSSKKWDVAFAVNAHSGWPRTNVFIIPGSDPEDPALAYGPRNRDRFDWFGTFDFRISYKKEFDKSALSFFFEVSNALNRSNACCVDFETEEDDDGNVVLLTTTENWYPVLPAIGILWEF